MDVWQTFCPTYSLEVEHIVTLHPLQIHIVFSVRMHCKVATVWSIKGSCCRELRYWQVAKESPGPESFCSLMPYWEFCLLIDDSLYPKEKNSWITFFSKRAAHWCLVPDLWCVPPQKSPLQGEWLARTLCGGRFWSCTVTTKEWAAWCKSDLSAVHSVVPHSWGGARRHMAEPACCFI